MYWFLVLMIRFIGRRVASIMTPYEFIVIFVLGGISIGAIVGQDQSMTNAMVAIVTIAVNHIASSMLRIRSTFFRKLVDGTPVLVGQNGEVNWHYMHALRLVEEDLNMFLRQKSIDRPEQMHLAIVERDGRITVIEREQQ